MSPVVSPVAIVLIVLLALLMVLAGRIGAAHGRLTGLMNSLRNAYRRVDEQLARGHESIGALLGRLEPGEGVEAAVRARAAADAARTRVGGAPQDPEAIGALARAERDLAAALGGLPISESDELESSRDRLGFACEIYNETVERYGKYRSRFPGSLAARLFKFPEVQPVGLGSEERD